MSNDNPYYDPEKFGLTIVATVQWGERNYNFDLTVFWKDTEGQLYMASDSGCSCPKPFENVYDLDQLNKVTKHEALASLDGQIKRMEELRRESEWPEEYGSAADAASAIEAINRL